MKTYTFNPETNLCERVLKNGSIVKKNINNITKNK